MKLNEILSIIYIYKLFTYDAWLISYYMHEHEDFFCKTVKPWIIAKFAGRGKTCTGLKLLGVAERSP